VLWETKRLPSNLQARFHTRSGLLTAEAKDGGIELDFPASQTESVDPPDGMLDALGVEAVHVGRTRFDYLVEVGSEDAVRAAAPDFARLRSLGVRGVIVTAAGGDADHDFVSRFFAPGAGIDEDPVTGSAHCALAPYWSAKLGRTQMVAFQASARGGIVRVAPVGDRVRLAGSAVTVIRGELLA